MIQNNPTNVSAAFEMLLEEIEAEIEFFNEIGKKAFEQRNYDRVREAVAHADNVTDFRNGIASLQAQWEGLASKFLVEEEEEKIDVGRRSLGRLQRGLRTPEETFRTPILRAVVELGGCGAVSDILDRVGAQMTGHLKDVDFEPLASDPNNLRWRNTAQWCRYRLVTQGLLKDDSRRGVWEITEQGRKYLSE